MIVSDNGTEFTCNAMLSWAQDHQVSWHFIAPGKTMQNGFCESFNGRMRDELLNETLFLGLDHAPPHSRTGSITTTIGGRIRRAYAASLPAICDRLRNPDQLRQSQIASPAPHGVKQPQTLIVAG